MLYLRNKLLIYFIKFINKFGRGIYLRKRLFSTEKILIKNFKEKESFSFIQIGANDGVSFDFLYDFVVMRDSSGILVEPIKEYFEELLSNYKNFSKIIKINKAIHPSQNQVTLYKISPKAQQKYPDWVKGIASLDINHHKKTNIEQADVVEEVVKAEDLMSVINKNYKSKKIDYFQIDTEGFDYEILKMFDFKKFKPLIVKYESVNLENKDKRDSLSMLKRLGYFTFEEFGDTIGVDLSKIKI